MSAPEITINPHTLAWIHLVALLLLWMAICLLADLSLRKFEEWLQAGTPVEPGHMDQHWIYRQQLDEEKRRHGY